MAPEPFRARTARLASLIAAALCLLATPAHALRVVTWNILAYPTNGLAQRQPLLRQVLAAIDPDLLIAQELNTAAGKDSLLNNVLNVIQPGQWAGQWTSLGTTGEGGAIFWKPAKMGVVNITAVNTEGPRLVLVGLVKPVGYATNPGWFRVFSVHFKAGVSDTLARRNECTNLRNYLNTVNTANTGPNFLLGGDTNFYGADVEGGYARLVESQLDNDGRGFDPLNMPGHWNSVPAYSAYFTQCPCLNCTAGIGQSGGGMDDRFDLWLTSQGLQDGAGLDLIPGSYLAFGNDGLHYNDDINGGGFNNAVGLALANALHDVSDHLPVVLQLRLPARVAATSQIAFGDVIVGAAGVTQPLSVTNAGTVPAEALAYSLVAPVGFTVAGGPFSLAAGAPANLHDVGLLTTTTGAKAGTLVMSTNAPDSLTKNVLLSARVLAHAVASLDSGAVVTAGSLDFGAQLADEFADLGVRVHDQGWNELQARLAVTAANVTGGGGRFSLPGFSPATFGPVGRTFAVHFDAAGATADSTYDATLTLTTADEALPGAAAAATLTVELHARVLGSTNDVPAGYALRLSPPRPNPARAGAEIAFELPAEAPVDVAIFDLSGRRVATLAAGRMGEGHHVLRWNAQDEAGRRVPAGLYFVRFTTPGLARVHRLALLP